MSGSIKQTECLIIGTGIAGTTCALIAAKEGIKVTLITKRSDPTITNTNLAQGGIVYKGENDSPELLKKDIIRAGRGINSIEAVEFLAENGPKVVEELLIHELHVDFTHIRGSEEEVFDLAREGAHSINRILYAADYTGREIEKTLIAALEREKNIEIIPGASSVDLITLQHHSKDILRLKRSMMLRTKCLRGKLKGDGFVNGISVL